MLALVLALLAAPALLVRTLRGGTDLPAGDHRLSWDGHDDEGRPAPPGYYLLTIESKSGGEAVRYDPSDSTGGELTQVSAARYDPAASAVRYALQKPSLLRIHLGLKGDGPLGREGPRRPTRCTTTGGTIDASATTPPPR